MKVRMEWFIEKEEESVQEETKCLAELATREEKYSFSPEKF